MTFKYDVIFTVFPYDITYQREFDKKNVYLSGFACVLSIEQVISFTKLIPGEYHLKFYLNLIGNYRFLDPSISQLRNIE
jgi:hypothetical protein